MSRDEFQGVSRRALMQYGLGAAAALGVLGRTTSVFAQRPLQWGSSSVGSTGYVIIEALASTVNRGTDLKNAAISTSGGAENMQLIAEEMIAFGQTTSTDWLPALNGEAPYASPVPANQVFAYTLFNCTPMVRADSGIQTLADLKGKRVMPAAAGGSTAVLMRVMLEAAGIADEVEWTYGSWRESYDALRSGAVDCIPSLLTNSRPSPIMSELESTTPVRILPIPDDVFARAQDINPGVVVGDLDPQTWSGTAETIQVASFSGILATHAGMEDEIVYKVTKAIFDNPEEVRKLGVQLKDIDPSFATRYMLKRFPVHPAAARYFQERGVWNDALTIAN